MFGQKFTCISVNFLHELFRDKRMKSQVSSARDIIGKLMNMAYLWINGSQWVLVVQEPRVKTRIALHCEDSHLLQPYRHNQRPQGDLTAILAIENWGG